MGDRIAVMNDGVLEQFGTPEELYERPANRFVAGFIGCPAMSFFDAAAEADGDGVRLRAGALDLASARAAAARRGDGRRAARGRAPVERRRARLLGPLGGAVEYVEALGRETFVGVGDRRRAADRPPRRARERAGRRPARVRDRAGRAALLRHLAAERRSPRRIGAVDAAEQFVIAATGGRRARAEALLAAQPEIARGPVGAARARPRLGRRPARARRPARLGAAALRRRTRCSRRPPRRPRCSPPAPTRTSPSRTSTATMSALYGAAGVVHDPEMTRLLLAAGADPDDGESRLPRDRGAGPRPAWRLLLEHGAHVDGTNAIAHALDDERLEHLRLLLSAPREEDLGAVSRTPCGAAAGRRRSGCSLEHGADVEPPRRRDVAGRRAAAHALPARRAARARRGDGRRSPSSAPARRSIRATSRWRPSPAGSGRTRRCRSRSTSTSRRSLILAALRGLMALVVELLGPDFRGVVGGSPRAAARPRGLGRRPALVELPARAGGGSGSRAATRTGTRRWAGRRARLAGARAPRTRLRRRRRAAARRRARSSSRRIARRRRRPARRVARGAASLADAVAQGDGAVGEAPLVEQLEVDAQPRAAARAVPPPTETGRGTGAARRRARPAARARRARGRRR